MTTYSLTNDLNPGRGLEKINLIIHNFLRSNGIVAVQSNPNITIEIDQYGYLRVNNHSIYEIFTQLT